MARINDPDAPRYPEDDLGPDPDPVGLEIHLLEEELAEAEADVERLRGEIRRLRDEEKWLRSMSSSGYARGQIKPAPHQPWTPAHEPEDLL